MERDLRFCWNFYLPQNHYSIYFTVTYLSIKNIFPLTNWCGRRLRPERSSCPGGDRLYNVKGWGRDLWSEQSCLTQPEIWDCFLEEVAFGLKG